MRQLSGGMDSNLARDFHRERLAVPPAWSVMPLGVASKVKLRLAASQDRATILEESAERRFPPVEHLRLVADVVAPAAEPVTKVEVKTPTPATESDIGEDDLPAGAYPDGDLAVVGVLACVLSAVATLGGLAWLVSALV